MKYTYEINSEKHTIEVTTIGDLMTTEVAAMALEIMTKAKTLKYKIVFDYRQSKNRISIGAAYSWFSTHFDNIDKELKYIPTAYIASMEDWSFYSFFELASNNKGICIRVFQEKNAAMKWLESL